MKKIFECIVRGRVEIDSDNVSRTHTTYTNNDKTTSLHMKTGETYYIRGKDMHEIGDELGIAAWVPANVAEWEAPE